MADTKRTRAQLLALLPDNSTGEISPQDIRDMLVSLFGVYGKISLKGNTTGQAFIADTAAKLLNWQANGLAVGMTPDYANNELQVDETGTYVIVGFLTPSSNGGGAHLELQIRIDGVEKENNHRALASGGDHAFMAVLDLLALNSGEKISIWGESDSSITITFHAGQLFALRIG